MSEFIPSTDFWPADPGGRLEVMQPWGLRHPVQLVLLVAASAGDFANFYITMSLVANAYPLVTLLVVAALTAAAIALAHGIGVLVRERQNAPRRHASPGLAALATGWGFLGVSAAAVRGVAPFDSGMVRGAVAQFGAASAPSNSNSSPAVHLVTSLLLLGLYLASGVLAAWIGYTDHNPVQATLRTAWRRLVWTGRRHRHRQTKHARAESVLRQHLDERERIATDHAAAIADRVALADELRAYTRVLIAARLGDSVATEALTRGGWINRPTDPGFGSAAGSAT